MKDIGSTKITVLRERWKSSDMSEAIVVCSFLFFFLSWLFFGLHLGKACSDGGRVSELKNIHDMCEVCSIPLLVRVIKISLTREGKLAGM